MRIPNLRTGLNVHFVTGSGLIKPAQVAKVWNQTTGSSNLRVYSSVSTTTRFIPEVEHRTAVPYDADGAFHTWHLLNDMKAK